MPAIKGLIRASQNGGVDPKENTTTQVWENRLQKTFMSLVKNNKQFQSIRFIGAADGGHEIFGGDTVDDKSKTNQNVLLLYL